jgi:hypothetical protein
MQNPYLTDRLELLMGASELLALANSVALWPQTFSATRAISRTSASTKCHGQNTHQHS